MILEAFIFFACLHVIAKVGVVTSIMLTVLAIILFSSVSND